MRGLIAPLTGIFGWAGPFARDRSWVWKLVRSGGNVAGAAFAAYLLWPNLRFFLQTHHPIGLVFAIQQGWVGLAFLTRRTPRTVSRRPLDWVVAYAAWFTFFLVRRGPRAGHRRPVHPRAPPAVFVLPGGRNRLPHPKPVHLEFPRRCPGRRYPSRSHKDRRTSSRHPPVRGVLHPCSLAPVPLHLVSLGLNDRTCR